MSCATCMRTFQLKSVSKAKTRGFRKHSVTSHISPGITVADAIIKVHDLRFATNSEQCVCAGCFYRIRKCNTLRCSLASAESDLCKFAKVIPAPTTRKRKLSTSTVPTTKRRKSENEEAFKGWLKEKSTQFRKEKLLKQREDQELHDGYFVRSREDCDKAYKQWLRHKTVEVKKARVEERQKSRLHRLTTRRTRRGLTLGKSIRDNQAFRYVDYYGYRF